MANRQKIALSRVAALQLAEQRAALRQDRSVITTAVH
jgi:hypothetical protein